MKLRQNRGYRKVKTFDSTHPVLLSARETKQSESKRKVLADYEENTASDQLLIKSGSANLKVSDHKLLQSHANRFSMIYNKHDARKLPSV